MDRAELQAVQLAMAFALGLGLGFFYDLYRVWFRRVMRRARGRLWAAAGDIGWWLLALAAAFCGLYRINGMELRFPVLALAAGGVCVYMGFFSPVLFPLLRRLLRLGWRLFSWLGGCFGGALALLLAPLVWLVELAFALLRRLLAVCGFAGRILARLARPFYRLARKIKNHLKKLKLEVDFPPEDDI